MNNNERITTWLTFPDEWLALQVLINCYSSEHDTLMHCMNTCEAFHNRDLKVDGCWNCPDYDPIENIAFHGRDCSLNGDVLAILKASWGIIGTVETGARTPRDIEWWLDTVNDVCAELFQANRWGEWFKIDRSIFIEWALHLTEKKGDK